jgi:hypothetical protein
MIITENAVKDTYVTDLSTQYNKGVDANFGQASTLDLFKIVGENKNVKPRSLFTILDVTSDLVASKTFTLKDSSDNSVVFIIDSGSTHEDGRVDASGRVIIGINNVSAGVNQLQKVINAINSVSSFNQSDQGAPAPDGQQNLKLNITATKLEDSKILLEQNIAGKSGDGVVTHDASGNFSITPFRRFEHSSILLKFDLASFKTNNVTTYGSSAFNSNFKAQLKLKDVGSSSVRPKDFKLRLRVLNEDFNEGLGRDTVHFSDLGDANFKTINTKTSKVWTKEGIVTSTDTSLLAQAVFSTLDIEDGSEDIVFDITSYIQHYLNTGSSLSQCFVIDFDHENMFDANTYFLKRFASRNNFNKNYHPKIEMKIKDTVFDIITYKDKKRYLDNTENFYLTNIIDKSPTAFSANLKLEFSYLDTDGSTNILSNNVIDATAVKNYKGSDIPGIKKFALTNNVIQSTESNSKFKAELIKNGYVDITLKYFYDSNTDGDVDSDEIILKTETVKFYLPDSNLEVFRNVRVVVDSDHKSMKVNNDFKQLKLSFIDTKKQYDAVKVPVDLISENIGNVNYSMFDVDTGEEIISKDGYYTKLIYNGEYYHLNLYASKNYKNKRASFVFYYTDYFSGLEKQIFDKSLIIRFE